jgi:hypothetical protein
MNKNIPTKTLKTTAKKALIALTAFLLVSALLPPDDSEARRKTRSGRYTATDLQLFNPNYTDSTTTVEWIDEAGQLQATLPVSLEMRSTRYFTVEESGLISATFVGAVEVVSATREVYGVVTHFDKGSSAPSFERGNEHYEVRDLGQAGTVLNAPLILQTGVFSTNISILNPADNGAAEVTIELYDALGAVTAYNTLVNGNALIEISPTIITAAPFVGSARILSDKPIAAYISVYDGAKQGGYSASVDTATTSRNGKQPNAVNADVPQGFFPNLQPTDDPLATRSVFIVNISTQPATVTLNSPTAVLSTFTVQPRAQITAAVPFSKVLTSVYIAANQPIESALVISDSTVTTTNRVTGLVLYPMLKLADQSLSLRAMHARNANAPALSEDANVVGPASAATHCAVAPTVFGGYRGWETSLKLLNPLSTTGMVTVTFFPTLEAGENISTVIVSRSLPPNTSVVPNYVGILGTNSPWAAYLESTVPFYGEATSIKPDEADGLMTYRLEPITCLQQREVYYMPIVIRQDL